MLENRITLEFFPDAANGYHVYSIRRSQVAELPHSHDFFQVCYVVNGKLVHRNGDQEVALEKGDAFIIPPDFTHSIISQEESTVFNSLSFRESLFPPHFSYSLAFKFLKALQMDTQAPEHLDVRLQVTLDETQQLDLETLFDCLIRESALQLELEETMAGSLIAAMLVILARAYFSAPDAQSQLAYINDCQHIMSACIQYIDANYMKPLTVSNLAKQFAISPSTFGIWFPQIAGLPFKRYLNNKRIEHAKALCSVRSLTLNEISRLVGYENSSTFYRNFIKIVDLSPEAYRKSLFPE